MISAETARQNLAADGITRALGCFIPLPLFRLSILECLVHFKHRRFPPGYHLIRIDIPKALENLIVELPKLKSSWRHEADYTQYIGDEFILNKEAPIMKVPSVVVPEEFNFLLNPLHKDFKKIKVLSSEALDLDNRLKLS